MNMRKEVLLLKKNVHLFLLLFFEIGILPKNGFRLKKLFLIK
jgi:hypothetical protein